MAVARRKQDWAEQNPDEWWQATCSAVRGCLAGLEYESCTGIGVAYQMHGLVLTDATFRPVRPAIIWCDSRAVATGGSLAAAVGPEYCSRHLLNHPGNFTAAKLAWVVANEAQVASSARWMMLPGDWLCAKLTGTASTTETGLSEMTLWDHAGGSFASGLFRHTGAAESLVPTIVPCAGPQGSLTEHAGSQLGLPEGTPVTYRAGDQPNNALTLGVLEPGQVAATAGTSGVAYVVTGGSPYDPDGSVNTFLHVNHLPDEPRRGVLMCVNGCGSTMSWLRGVTGTGYADLDDLAASVPVGALGVTCLPYGNGAERTLQNRTLGLSVSGLSSSHGTDVLSRAVQEGIAFAYAFGLQAFADLGIETKSLVACEANMFRSPVFREALVNTVQAPLNLRSGDGAVGAAIGAGAGAGLWSLPEGAALATQTVSACQPETALAEPYATAYGQWKRQLARALAP